MKICTKCGIEKDESEFWKANNVKSGLRAECKECKKKKRKPLTAEAREISNLRRKEHRDKNIEEYRRKARERSKTEKYKKRRKEHRDKNILKIREIKKISYEKNKEKILIKNKKYREANRKTLIMKQIEKHYSKLKSNPEYKLKFNIRACFNRAIKNKNIKKSLSFNKYTGTAYADYIAYFEQNFPVEFSQITEKNKYHIDHIIPCAVYDFNNPEEICKCWQPENLRIISALENISKSDKLDFDLIEKHNIWHLLPESIKVKRSA